MSTTPAEEVCRLFPAIDKLESGLRQEILGQLHAATLPSGSIVFADNDSCEHFPLLYSGTIRVFKASDDGREVLLYRVEPGDTCLLTSSCLLGNSRYPAQGCIERDASLAILPKAAFDAAVQASDQFRAFVFSRFANRLTEMMLLVEAVAFQRLDRRLAALLLARGRSLMATHQQIANDLGSSREIVSRLLKDFEEQGWVELRRGHILILNENPLAELAGKDLP